MEPTGKAGAQPPQAPGAQPTFPIYKLPAELVQHVLAQMPLKDLLMASQASSTLLGHVVSILPKTLNFDSLVELAKEGDHRASHVARVFLEELTFLLRSSKPLSEAYRECGDVWRAQAGFRQEYAYLPPEMMNNLKKLDVITFVQKVVEAAPTKPAQSDIDYTLVHFTEMQQAITEFDVGEFEQIQGAANLAGSAEKSEVDKALIHLKAMKLEHTWAFVVHQELTHSSGASTNLRELIIDRGDMDLLNLVIAGGKTQFTDEDVAYAIEIGHKDIADAMKAAGRESKAPQSESGKGPSSRRPTA